jgi:tetratricopeptide (TPR) repeat protein
MVRLLLMTVLLAGCITPGAHQKWEGARARGETHFAEANWAAAITEFRAALKANRWDQEGWQLLGLAYFGAEKYDLAEENLRKAIDVADGVYSQARMNLGTLYLQQERYDEALVELEKVLDDPEYKQPDRARQNKGWALYNLGRLPEARAEFREVLRRFSNFCPAMRTLGLVEEAEGKLDDALVRYRQAHECDPTDLQTQLTLGILEARLDLVTDACAHLGTVHTIDEYGALRVKADEVLAMLPCESLQR